MTETPRFKPEPEPPTASVTRRVAIGALLASAGGFALLGPSAGRQAPRGRIILEYWEKWTGHEGEAMQRLIDEFNASQDRVWVRYSAMSAIDQKATIAIAGNSPPALVGLWSFNLPAFVQSGAVIPLNELNDLYGEQTERALADTFGAPDTRLDRSHYTDPVWDLISQNGLVGGVPNTCSTMALYYSRSRFAEVGLDPDKPPQTIEQMDTCADACMAYDADGSVARAGFVHREPGWWNWLWGAWFGGRVYDEQTRAATCDTPQNIAGYEWVQSYSERYGVQNLSGFQSGFGGYSSLQQPLLSGKVAMTLHGPFLANVINKFKPDFDYGVTPFPMAAAALDENSPRSLMECDVLCIPRGCPHPAEAFEFLMFTQARRNAEAIAIAHAKPSPLRQTTPDFASRHPNRFVELHNTLAASAGAFTFPKTRANPQIVAEFDAQISAFTNLLRPARDILTDIQARAQSAVARVNARQDSRAAPQT
ncbi:MAG: multiple sugar transport system substrate-binding protein [Phycisphaerales bacterium]